MGAVVAGLSHKLSLSNGEKLVTTRSVGSPTILLLRGLISESDSLLYPWVENKDLVCPRLRAVFLSVQGFSLRKRGERTGAKLLLRLTLRGSHNVNSVVIELSLSRFGGALQRGTLDRFLSTWSSESLRKR